MKPFTMYKNFGGKRFSYATFGDLKSEAQRRAEDLRKLGFNVRITKEKSLLGKIYYPVWKRRKES